MVKTTSYKHYKKLKAKGISVKFVTKQGIQPNESFAIESLNRVFNILNESYKTTTNKNPRR